MVYFFSDIFELKNNMQAAGALAITTAAGPQTGKDKLEPRLFALLQNNGVSDRVMDAFGDNGLVALNVFTHIAPTAEKLAAVLGKDPFGLKGDDLLGILEMAKVTSAWETAKTMREVEVKTDADRVNLALPPELKVGDLETAMKLFEKAEYELTKVTTPSKGYFERKMAQIESYFEAEPYTSVTNL